MKEKSLIPIIILIIYALILGTGCTTKATTQLTSIQSTAGSPAPGVPTISVQDAYALIRNNQGNPNFVILDVRTADEFNSGYIAGTINIDYYSSEFKTNIGKLDKNKRYLVYCRTGIRGAASVQIMMDLGFKQTQNMAGGITEWIQDGYPTVK